MHRYFIYILPFFILKTAVGQFAPAVGQPGTSAIHKDSSIIINWVKYCTVSRGPQDISMLSNGNVSIGSESNVVGVADGISSMSLGDGGSAICEFAYTIKDDAGPDFAVFENSFVDYFLELAFVEASSDGIHYFRFPASSLTDTSEQVGTFDSLRCTLIHNLAGKYVANYGTPFDISELPDTALLDKQNIRYIKVIDVIGSIQAAYCSRDAQGRKINDPWPTPFPTGGFDLEAIAVMHQNIESGMRKTDADGLFLYRDYSNETLNIIGAKLGQSLSIFNISGHKIMESNYNGNIDISGICSGAYILRYENKNLRFIK
jgi:hypothetical protein